VACSASFAHVVALQRVWTPAGRSISPSDITCSPDAAKTSKLHSLAIDDGNQSSSAQQLSALAALLG